jgi:hypothetical protein
LTIDVHLLKICLRVCFTGPEARMSMSGRVLHHAICVLAAVALVVAVISSPIRLTSTSHAAPPPGFLPRNFAILDDDKTGHSGQSATSARPSLSEADSLQSDIEDELDADLEDELTVTPPPASLSFDVLPSPCPEPYSELVSLAGSLAARPLRC